MQCKTQQTNGGGNKQKVQRSWSRPIHFQKHFVVGLLNLRWWMRVLCFSSLNQLPSLSLCSITNWTWMTIVVSCSVYWPVHAQGLFLRPGFPEARAWLQSDSLCRLETGTTGLDSSLELVLPGLLSRDRFKSLCWRDVSRVITRLQLSLWLWHLLAS